MKKTILLITSVLLAAGLQSCSGTREMDNSRLCHISAQTALFGAPQTKTQVGELVGDELLINWTPGDQIGIVTSNSTVSCFTNQTAEESAYGDFTGLLSGTPVHAFYPYVDGVADLTAVPFRIETSQIYSGPESIGLYDVRVATTVNDTPEGYRMHFNSLTCLLRVEVDLSGLEAYTEMDEDEDGDGGPLGEKTAISFGTDEILTQFNLSINSGEGGPSITCSDENATYVVDMTSDTPHLSEDSAGEGEYSSSLVVLFDEENPIPAAGSGTVVFYAVVAPAALRGETLEIGVDMESGTKAHWLFFKTTLASDLEAGHYYTVPLKASVLNAMEGIICCEFDLEEDGEGGDDIED